MIQKNFTIYCWCLLMAVHMYLYISLYFNRHRSYRRHKTLLSKMEYIKCCFSCSILFYFIHYVLNIVYFSFSWQFCVSVLCVCGMLLIFSCFARCIHNSSYLLLVWTTLLIINERSIIIFGKFWAFFMNECIRSHVHDGWQRVKNKTSACTIIRRLTFAFSFDNV